MEDLGPIIGRPGTSSRIKQGEAPGLTRLGRSNPGLAILNLALDHVLGGAVWKVHHMRKVITADTACARRA